jgi:N-acetyl-gamma-glutamyl-phosphate reductase
MKTKVFIDGREGTTGLEIEQRLLTDSRYELIEIQDSLRKDPEARKACLNSADVAILCLPDAAAIEATALTGTDTVLIDASTAHRINPDWVYGFPELEPGQAQKIAQAKRIAVPGCHAVGFISLIHPLVALGLISPQEHLSCFSLTGYSGGGKKMIAEYESENPPSGARPYALSLNHKHLPEMKLYSGLDVAPLFVPIVAPVRQGMLVQVPLWLSKDNVLEALMSYYANTAVTVLEGEKVLENGRIPMDSLNGTDQLELMVYGHATQCLLVARQDNLGKGASGSALACLHLVTKEKQK